MADEEAEKDRGPEDDVNVVLTGLKQRLQELQETMAKESLDSPIQSSSNYCQDFCRALLESAGHWRIEDEPMPVVQVYMVALRSYAETSAYLSSECDSVPLVIERLALSFVELLLSQKELPEDLWNDFRSCVQFSHSKLQETGITQLSMLWTLGQQGGVWSNPVLQSILSGEQLVSQQIEELLLQEGLTLLELRVKQLRKDQQLEKAARLAKSCSESTLCEGKANFKQMFLVCLCLCTSIQQDQLMEEISKVDCSDALEMICNLESDGDEKGAFTLCSAFLSRQLMQADAYCAWELTLFWSKLLKRLEPSEKAFLDKCRQMSLLSKTVYHILFLIKVIQSEINETGLSTCVEMCIRALRMQTEDANTKATVCKTIACLLPNDLEVKRACQLTQFLLEPTVDSYYAVETLYNEPDQKLDEENMAVPNSLRCELLLVFKTQWPFDPEFWDWKTLKRRCLALMGDEASIVSSADTLNDTDEEEEEDIYIDDGFLESADQKVSGTYELSDQMDKKQKNKEMKRLRDKGFISARFRNWQVYMQYCVLCDKEFLGHRIIRHAQTHIDRGVYSCPICTQSFTTKDTLIPHVNSHVKQSSKDRLTAMKTNRKLANPKTAAPIIASLMGTTENDVSKMCDPLGQNTECNQNNQPRLSEEPGEEVVCPVGTCKKTFKYYRNLIAHVKAHRDNEEAKSYLELQSNKVVCQYCRRHFVSVNHLNDHLQVHCGTKPYICIQLNCKASFLSNTELLVHRKTHSHFKVRCMFPNCGRVFTEAFKLYDHEAKHYKTFTCKFVQCGKVFHTQQQLDLHHKDHTIKIEETVSEQTEQTPRSCPSPDVIERSPEMYGAETVSVGKPETLESLLKASQTPIRTVDRFRIKTEVQDEHSFGEASQSEEMETDLPADLYCKKQIHSSQTLDHLKSSPQCQKQHISPFEATINKMLRENTLLQSELNLFSSSFSQSFKKYSERNATSPSPLQTPSSPTASSQSVPMATTQPFPMATKTQSITKAESRQSTPVVAHDEIPIPTQRPSPIVAHRSSPMVATQQPIPLSAKQQAIPMVATQQPIPMAATQQPIPMAATHHPSPMATTHHPSPMATTHHPSPMATTHHPSPMATTHHPSPMATTHHPSPMATTHHPSPMAAAHHPIPMAAAHHPIPMAAAHRPSPMAAAHHPSPMATTQQPIPMVTTHHHSPMAATQQSIPMAAKQQPIPTVATHHPSLMAATQQPIPMAASQPISMSHTQPKPVPSKLPALTAEKCEAVSSANANTEENMLKTQAETVLRERYHCPFEMCGRNYSCYKSVSKHIKTSHPDMYAIRRIPRCEIKVTYVSGSPPKSFGGTQKKPKAFLPPPHSNTVTNANGEDVLSSENTTGPQLMEKVLNPIVVAQLNSTTSRQGSVQTLNQHLFEMASQPEKVHNCGTTMMHLPRPSEPITASVMPKGYTELDQAATVSNSIEILNTHNSHQTLIPNPIKSVLVAPDSQEVWSGTNQNQQMQRGAISQLHSTRPTTSLPTTHQPGISLHPDVNMLNSLTKAHRDMQSSPLYRQPGSTMLPPNPHKKTEETNLPLWSPASDINHAQPAAPSQTLSNTSRTMGAASSPLPIKGNQRSVILGPDLNQASVISKPTSNARCSPLPPYTPPSASLNNAATAAGKHKSPKTCQPTLTSVIQKTHLSNVKHSQMPPTAMYNTNVPVSTNNAAPNPATSMQSYKPSLSASIKTENCQASTHLTPHMDPTDLKNTNRTQHPQSQPERNTPTSENNPEKTAPKRNKVRWPAIIRDGKVFCPRCYRSFKNTKSLGGHLSKRLKCNPFEEMELNSDLPASFLDLLNSDQTVNDSPQNHSMNPHETCYTEPHTSKSQGSIEQTHYRSPEGFDQKDGETSNDTLQQVMTASNMADLCVAPLPSQFQKPSVCTGKDFQSSTVTPSEEGGGEKVGSTNFPYYTQPRPPGKRYPTPLLSQALKENHSSASVLVMKKYQSEIPSKDQVKVPSTVTPNAHPENSSTNKAKQVEKSTVEQSIKKKLREQILAGDFQRRNNLIQLANACHNSESQSPMSCISDVSSKNEDWQITLNSKSNWPKGETFVIIPGTAAEVEDLLKTNSFTSFRPRQCSALKQDSGNPTCMSLSDCADTDPNQLSLSQQQGFSELQNAFMSFNLIDESPDPGPNRFPEVISPEPSRGSSKASDDSQSTASKRFSCVCENCHYVTLSSAAYWRHLNKIHDFGFEQINAVKRKYGHYATFQCQKCPRTFTRNPNLKAHYISAHQLPIEEIEALDLKRKQDKAALMRMITIQSVTNQELLHQKQSDPRATSVIQSLASANMHGALKQGGHDTTGQQNNKWSKPFPNGCQLPMAHLPQTEVPSQVAKRPLTTGKPVNRPTAVKTSNDLQKKSDKKPLSNDAFSQYKPYRCVHKDCEAAFTIQHNLILHYRAVHQSALSALEVNKEQDQNEVDEAMELEEDEEELQISEFRCQVKDCSRVFQEVTHLVQHYLRLHEFTIDKVGDLLSVIRLGRFTCGHEGCTVSFTAFWKYVAHIKELHKEVRLSKPENMYKCEIEGCDRAYATKSNMLRHLMKKHNDYYLQRQPKSDYSVKQNSKSQYQLNKTSDGKENIESNKTSTLKDNDAKRSRKINNYWTKYEKPVLKSKVEAAAMCTKSYPLQYPCMIKGCESVMNSEKSILKHYTVHGLTEKFLEQQRSHYIFCKKFPRQKNGSVRSDDSKSGQSSESEPELMGHNGTEESHLDGSRPFLRKRTSPIIPAALLDSLSNDDSSDGSQVIKRKRGRPKRIVEKIVKRKKVSLPPKESESRDECSDSSISPSERESEHSSLSAFKPMGFEMSFLKFLEQSNKTQPSFTCEIPLIGPWVRLSQLNPKELCIKFNNPKNLKSLDKVKIIVDKTFGGVTELMLRQLQDMQPLVLLGKK